MTVAQRVSAAQYDEMHRAGELGENDRTELINGEIRWKMPPGNPHVACVNRLNWLLARIVPRAIVSVQNPIGLPDDRPEPDVCLLRPRDDFYETMKPGAADILLLIEVADSSEDFDRDVKGPIYAAAGIAEYWMVCLSSRTVEVRRKPAADGTWGEVRIVGAGGTVSPAAFTDVVVSVDELFPRGA